MLFHKNYDCTNYDSDKCLKGSHIVRNLRENDDANFMLVGCLGVYCKNGLTDLKHYIPQKEKKLKKKLKTQKNNI